MTTPTFELDPTSTGLVITDAQKDLLCADGALAELFHPRAEARGVVSNLVRLKQAAEKAGIPVFYSRVEFSENDLRSWPQGASALQGMLLQKKAMHGPGADYVDELAAGDEVVWLTPRKGPTGFWGNDIDVQLRQRGVKHVIMGGMIANLCLEANIRDAVTHGYEVTVVSDATETHTAEAYQAALANFQLLARRVVTTDEALASLERAPAAVV